MKKNHQKLVLEEARQALIKPKPKEIIKNYSI